VGLLGGETRRVVTHSAHTDQEKGSSQKEGRGTDRARIRRTGVGESDQDKSAGTAERETNKRLWGDKQRTR